MKLHHRAYHYIKQKIDVQREHIRIFLLLGLIVLSIILIIHSNFLDKIYQIRPAKMGASFSPTYAKSLGLDPKQVYFDILTDLKVTRLRLPAYWNEIEIFDNQYKFEDLDYYIREAKNYQASVILAIGYKLPRWPECRSPAWLSLGSERVRKEKQLRMVRAVIEHFNQNPTVIAWQVENEPLFPFGICPRPDLEFLQQEVAVVRSVSQKPVIITDSGELRGWVSPMMLSDYFGTTLYRTVYTPVLGPFNYPLKPWFYRAKAYIIKKLFAQNIKKVFITELQVEPWENKFILGIPIDKQLADFPLAQFENNVNFARKVGFDEIYLWGTEWWYFMKTHGHPQYWNFAKTLF